MGQLHALYEGGAFLVNRSSLQVPHWRTRCCVCAAARVGRLASRVRPSVGRQEASAKIPTPPHSSLHEFPSRHTPVRDIAHQRRNATANIAEARANPQKGHSDNGKQQAT
jgi:hypothetical protein